MNPLAVDLYCGLGGWAEGFLAEGYDVVGFDIERHDYGTGGYPGQLVLQDVLTLHGSQFKGAAVIVASPPCQAYSYRAMPWKRAKALPPPDNTLFEACFRIQREACDAAGRHIPLIVENVRGAQKWVGRSAWHFGSYHLWGDVPALMPIPHRAQKFNPDGTAHPPGSWFAVADSQNRGARKVPGLDWSQFGKLGYKAQGFNVTAAQRYREGVKGPGGDWFKDGRQGQDACLEGLEGIPHRTKGHWTNPAEHEGVKQHGSGREWFAGEGKISRVTSSKSDSRKAASAMIAKIPFPLSLHIARSFKPSLSERLPR